MTTTRPSILASLTCVAAVLLIAPPLARAQSFSIDTGPGGSTTIGSPALFASGSTACSPQPACSVHFQFLAGQFTLTTATSIDTIQVWVAGGNGSMAVKIRPSTATGVPSLATSLYSKTYTVPGTFGFYWLQFSNYGAVLPAGTYWVALEPVSGSQLNLSMPLGAADPLAGYAFYGDGNAGYNKLPANNTLGFRISGTYVPSEAFGTAGRTILSGSAFGFPFTPHDSISGDTSDIDTTRWFFEIPSGWSYARGQIVENGLSVGAYSATSGGGICAESCTSATGAGHGVAFRTFKNTAGQSVTFRLNGVADGAFQRNTGQAAAGIYAFDPALFTAAITGSGKTAGEFLLTRDDISRLSNPAGNTLATLFPGAVLGSTFQVLTGPADQIFSTPLTTGLMTVAADASVTVMFDISAYAPPGSTANFASTLKPAANLFTDQNGNAITTFLPLGGTTAAPLTPASILLAPSSSTNQVEGSQTLTATVKTSTNVPVANALVFFSIGSGPNANVGGPVVTDGTGVATFTYTDAMGPGTDAVQAKVGALQSATAQITWQGAGSLDHMTTSPAVASVSAGGSQAYTAEAFDKFGTSLGDVTGLTVFSIAPNGSCTGASCSATLAGSHTVTASYGAKTATATLTVTASSLDHITVAPASATIAAGGSQAYTTQGFDGYNNSLGNVTAGTTFTIAPDGSCTGATCTASAGGAHTVTANASGKTATATLTVSTGGGSTPYTFEGFYQPIDMSTQTATVWNTLKGGQAVPIRWRLLLNGAPVSDPTSFVSVSSVAVACGSVANSVEDAIEELATGNSGLQYNGDGQWQYNWATSASYKSTCRAMMVKFKDGTTSPFAYFHFK